MKMRKIISFVLVLALVLGSFSMAFAATPATTGLSDIAGIANEDAIQVNNDLGIIAGYPDGTFGPEKAVTRAEFAAMITRALAIPESALAGYSAASFKDMTGYGWATGYIGFCASKGIMLGDGMGNAMPARTINTNEAMTMVLRAIGYVNNSAELVGTWPANYVTVAQNVGLYDDVAAVANVDRANAAQIIYNALTVQKVSVNTDGDTKYLTTGSQAEEANLLNTGLGCDTDADKIITGADYDGAVMNITKYMGAYGTAYTNNDGDIVAFTVDSVALTGAKDGTYFKADGVKYNFTNAYTSGVAIVNTDAGNPDQTFSIASIDTFANNGAKDDDGDVTINVELSGKTIKNVYSVVGWVATDDAQVAAADVDSIMEDHELLTGNFVEDDNDDIDFAAFQLHGVASLDKIAKDDVVYVYSDDTDEIRKIAVGTETVTGNVTEEKAGDYVIVNGTKYEAATLAGAELDLPGLDEDVTLYLDADGYVYDFEATGGVVNNYALVKAFENNDDSIDNSRIKLYTSDDATKTYTFADENADIDWVSGSAVAEITTPAGLIGYELDSDGYIDTLNTNFVDTTGTSVVLQSSKVLVADGEYLSIASDVVVFAYDGASAYSVGTIADVDKSVALNGATVIAVQYILNDDGDVAALLVDEEFFTGGTDDSYGVINTVTSVKDGDDTVEKLVGFINGVAFTKQTDGDQVAAAEILIGQLNVFTINAAGTITEVVTLGAVDIDDASGYVALAALVTDTNSDRTVLTITGGALYTVASDAVVYEAVLDTDGALDYYEVSSLTKIKATYTVWLFDTKGADADGIANVVIFADDALVL